MALWLGFFLVPMGYASTPEPSVIRKTSRRIRGHPWAAEAGITTCGAPGFGGLPNHREAAWVPAMRDAIGPVHRLLPDAAEPPPRNCHPEALTEPSVTVSPHTAHAIHGRLPPHPRPPRSRGDHDGLLHHELAEEHLLDFGDRQQFSEPHSDVLPEGFFAFGVA